jgi:hypothetical protein
VTTPQYEATLHAVANIDFAMSALLAPNHPEPRGPAWTDELIDRVASGLRSCRWFLATGFDPSVQFGSWLRITLEAKGLGRGAPAHDFAASTVWRAAEDVDRLRDQWRPEWSM